MARPSSQKFIARNRAPRVQIEYDVELYGAEKKIQLPFVMGVMANLSGKPTEPLPDVADRKFLEIDIDNFDQRLKAMKPRVAFQVPNTLTGDGNLMIGGSFGYVGGGRFTPCFTSSQKHRWHSVNSSSFDRESLVIRALYQHPSFTDSGKSGKVVIANFQGGFGANISI